MAGGQAGRRRRLSRARGCAAPRGGDWPADRRVVPAHRRSPPLCRPLQSPFHCFQTHFKHKTGHLSTLMPPHPCRDLAYNKLVASIPDLWGDPASDRLRYINISSNPGLCGAPPQPAIPEEPNYDLLVSGGGGAGTQPSAAARGAVPPACWWGMLYRLHARARAGLQWRAAELAPLAPPSSPAEQACGLDNPQNTCLRPCQAPGACAAPRARLGGCRCVHAAVLHTVLCSTQPAVPRSNRGTCCRTAKRHVSLSPSHAPCRRPCSERVVLACGNHYRRCPRRPG